jgi:protein-tyrosine phosphatase
MSGFVDLHCHWIAQIDDGARSVEEGLDMLRALSKLGFSQVVATPHMRPGMFDNTRATLTSAFQKMRVHLAECRDLPEVALSSEHYFDETVFSRILSGEALPYPGERAILLEFYQVDFPTYVEQRLFDIRRHRLLPVIAHPERYQCIWKRPETLERLVELGSAALLDTAALVGKYGRKPKKCAEELLERGLYHAACSDAHRPEDAEAVGRGMEWIDRKYGDDEIQFLFQSGPRSLLAGELPE